MKTKPIKLYFYKRNRNGTQRKWKKREITETNKNRVFNSKTFMFLRRDKIE